MRVILPARMAYAITILIAETQKSSTGKPSKALVTESLIYHVPERRPLMITFEIERVEIPHGNSEVTAAFSTDQPTARLT